MTHVLFMNPCKVTSVEVNIMKQLIETNEPDTDLGISTFPIKYYSIEQVYKLFLKYYGEKFKDRFVDTKSLFYTMKAKWENYQLINLIYKGDVLMTLEVLASRLTESLNALIETQSAKEAEDLIKDLYVIIKKEPECPI